jgi:hypothetical protein
MHLCMALTERCAGHERVCLQRSTAAAADSTNDKLPSKQAHVCQSPLLSITITSTAATNLTISKDIWSVCEGLGVSNTCRSSIQQQQVRDVSTNPGCSEQVLPLHYTSISALPVRLAHTRSNSI